MAALNIRKITGFWAPLAATWLMMALEGPFLAAVIARLADPKYNLAAYGVAFSFALIIEAPIIMIMSAATALVTGRTSLVRLRTYTYAMNGCITAVMLVGLIPPVFDLIARQLLELPDEVARLVYVAYLLLLPWPGAIGYRRFYQGIMIRNNLTRRVAYGTVVRLSTMAVTAVVLYAVGGVPGAWVGAAALSVGVTMEAVASRLMSRRIVSQLLQDDGDSQSAPGYREIHRFYMPLAMTSILAMGVHPLLTFFMGRSRMAIESLAVWPVVHVTSFIFRCFGISFQETAIALLGERQEGYRALRDFGNRLAVATGGAYALLVLTPLSHLWMGKVSGLSADLAASALLPAQIVLLMPSMEVLLSLQRALLVHARMTRAITWATAVEVVGIIVVLFAGIRLGGATGAVAAAIAVTAGRLTHILFLMPPCLRARRLAEPLIKAQPAGI